MIYASIVSVYQVFLKTQDRSFVTKKLDIVMIEF